jgi:hypothetical protein
MNEIQYTNHLTSHLQELFSSVYSACLFCFAFSLPLLASCFFERRERMLRVSQVLRVLPQMQLTAETTPLRVTRNFYGNGKPLYAMWWDGTQVETASEYHEKVFDKTWPYTSDGWVKGSRDVLPRWYSPAALKVALEMIPDGFEVADVPRPPERIKAQSEGIVGRWYTNFWTLHSMKYQCMLSGIPWAYGERSKPKSNFDEPYFYVDYDESKMIRDYRSRWINIHRSMADSSKKVLDASQEDRFRKHKKVQDTYWASRKVFINRLKSMQTSGGLEAGDVMPIKDMSFSVLSE